MVPSTVMGCCILPINLEYVDFLIVCLFYIGLAAHQTAVHTYQALAREQELIVDKPSSSIDDIPVIRFDRTIFIFISLYNINDYM